MNYHPVFLSLEGRSVVVIGGGHLALAKVRELLERGARVKVVAQDPDPGLRELTRSGGVELIERGYRTGDLEGAWLAFASAGDPRIHAQVHEDAERAHVWLNAVDDVPNCSFIAGSVHRQGDVLVAVTTSGACPALAVRLRQLFARLVGPEQGAFARFTATLRERVARTIPDFERRKRFWYRLVDSDAIRHFKKGEPDRAKSLTERLLTSDWGDETGEREGRVVLVGAGPGDPGLITTLGSAWLRAADVVVHDRLVSPALLAEARSDATMIDVGKTPDRASISQAEINAILVREASAGQLVVRLKGGDPFVFGRGAEEVDALEQAGIRCEVVPGVTSAIAAPAAAGIPVTKRGVAGAFAVVTGRDAPGAPPLDWDALAAMPTLVVLMGRAGLPAIVDRLIAAGRSPDTPAAVVSQGTLPGQSSVEAPLSEIVAAVEAAGIRAPATLVIGEVARAAASQVPAGVGR